MSLPFPYRQFASARALSKHVTEKETMWREGGGKFLSSSTVSSFSIDIYRRRGRRRKMTRVQKGEEREGFIRPLLYTTQPFTSPLPSSKNRPSRFCKRLPLLPAQKMGGGERKYFYASPPKVVKVCLGDLVPNNPLVLHKWQKPHESH